MGAISLVNVTSCEASVDWRFAATGVRKPTTAATSTVMRSLGCIARSFREARTLQKLLPETLIVNKLWLDRLRRMQDAGTGCPREIAGFSPEKLCARRALLRVTIGCSA